LLFRRPHVVVDVVEVDGRQVRAPGGHGLLEKRLQRLEAELPHPVGLALHRGDFLNKLAGKPLARLEYVLFRIAKAVTVLLIDVDYGLCHPCFPLSSGDPYLLYLTTRPAQAQARPGSRLSRALGLGPASRHRRPGRDRRLPPARSGWGLWH